MIKQSLEVNPRPPVGWNATVTAQPTHAPGAEAAAAAQAADDSLAAAVERALEGAEVMTSRHFNDFALAVHAGVVLLRGHVLRSSSKKQIELVAGQTPGVTLVDNQLVADTDLEGEVARALSAVTSQNHDRLFVNVRQGIIDLSGYATSAAVRDAAEQCAANVPHVRAVVNHIAAPNVPNDAAQARLVQPRVGQEVIGQDRSLGHVESVIISPRNRRVSAIVVRGKFPSGVQTGRGMLPGDMPAAERRIVIPLSAIQNVNRRDVMLNITGVQAAQCADFDAAQFAPMDAADAPPYPYLAADVLMELPELSAA
jgi:osmotically-inducible protein OsmY